MDVKFQLSNDEKIFIIHQNDKTARLYSESNRLQARFTG